MSPSSTTSRESDMETGKDGFESRGLGAVTVPTNGMWSKLNSQVSLEGHGVAPVAEDERTDAKWFDIFTLWIGMNGTISAFSTGTLGPLLYGLSLRDTALCILFFNLFSCSLPSYFAVFGPRTGMRQMGIARWSYGKVGVILPAFLNCASFVGFCAVNAIVAGQVLSYVRPGSISVNVGIIIIAVISMIISFCGYRVLHAAERYAWIPVILSFILLAGFGGRHLGTATAFAADTPATAANVLSWASLTVGFSLSWCGCSADFNTYLHKSVSSTKIFALTFAGLYLPCVLIQTLGAAFAAAALSGLTPTWETAFTEGSIGGLMSEALLPLHWFGKVLLVMFALGMISNNAPTVYAFSLSVQIVIPWAARIPRYFFPVLATAIYLPIAIVGARDFSAALSNFLGLLGPWSAIFASVFLTEHLVFRHGRFSSYDISVWNDRTLLPLGAAAMFSSLAAGGVAALSMDQVWWRGPIARRIAGSAEYGGDVAIWLPMASAALLYMPTRWMERKWTHR